MAFAAKGGPGPGPVHQAVWQHGRELTGGGLAGRAQVVWGQGVGDTGGEADLCGHTAVGHASLRLLEGVHVLGGVHRGMVRGQGATHAGCQRRGLAGVGLRRGGGGGAWGWTVTGRVVLLVVARHETCTVAHYINTAH